MPVRLAPDPPVLYRIGRAPNPLAWPPRAFTGGGRYDHPNGEFLVLYTAAQRRGAFLETLDSFRPAIKDIAVAQRLPEGDAGDVQPPPGVIPDAFFRKLIGRLRVAPGQRWLDLRSPETHQALRTALADTLVALGYRRRFVWGDLLSHDHRLTQAIACWAYGQGYHGVAYTSCHDPGYDCWALFDRAAFFAAGQPEPILPDDPDLMEVAHLFQLMITQR